MLDPVKRFAIYTKVFSSEEGKRFVADFFEVMGVFKSSFVPNDPQATAFKEGQRAAGILIMNILNQDPALIAQYTAHQNTQSRLEMILNDGDE